MGTWAEIRDGLKTRLDVATNIRPYDVWPDTLNAPAAIVMPRRFSYQSMGGADASGEYEVDIVVLVQVGSTLGRAQDELDSYLAPSGGTSIPVALLGDRTLGGKADDLVIMGWGDYGLVETNGVQYLSATLDLRVLV